MTTAGILKATRLSPDATILQQAPKLIPKDVDIATLENPSECNVVKRPGPMILMTARAVGDPLRALAFLRLLPEETDPLFALVNVGCDDNREALLGKDDIDTTTCLFLPIGKAKKVTVIFTVGIRTDAYEYDLTE